MQIPVQFLPYVMNILVLVVPVMQIPAQFLPYAMNILVLVVPVHANPCLVFTIYDEYTSTSGTSTCISLSSFYHMS